MESRVKRLLPPVPTASNKKKDERKSRSTGALTQSSTKKQSANSASSLVETAGDNLTFSPPGTKPRVFTGYSTPYHDISFEGEDSSVMVAVRVRPFSDREKRLGAKQMVRMYKNDLTITSKDSNVHRFQYDHCFWSFDEAQGPFADQVTVYRELAQPLLDRAFQGYNTCLFAYGQTGSGKSYCIMGEPSANGVIPQFANELYERIEGTSDSETSFKVEVSYYEIYKERIHDLLASTKHKSRTHLRVREHPVMGPYVEDLSIYVSSSYKDIEQWLALGNRFRATAATGMNDRSSRSHSVFTILLTQTKVIEGEDHCRVSRINLIDLAGSERSSVAMTSGERLKEGASINKSLHTLGKVISLLSEKSTGKRKKVYIPYRDSTLTWLLKESLGGNSKTAMIATISPADLHYEESLSTLRYAQQARTIVNVARINEDPSSRLIRELRQEIEWLRTQLGIHGNDPSEMLDILKSHEEVKQLREKLDGYEKLMKETTRSWEERLRQTEERKEEEAKQLAKAGVSFKVDNRLPNLVNLNEDPQLSEMLLYVLKKGRTTVGRHIDCDIQLSGALVMKDHCSLYNVNDTVTLEPSADSEAQTFINGTAVTEITALHHGDRVIIAAEHFFRFNHPLEVESGAVKRGAAGQTKGFEFAHAEYIKAQTARLEAEQLKERQLMMKELEAVKQAAESSMSQQRTNYEEKLRSLEGNLSAKSSEVTLKEQENQEAEERISKLELINKELEEETIAQRHIIEMERMKTEKEYEEMAQIGSNLMQELEQEKQKLENDIDMLHKSKTNREKQKEMSDINLSIGFVQGSEILRVATRLQEANVISKNLGKPFNFSREGNYENDEVVKVRVTNTQLNKYTHWDLDKFEYRLEQMREIYQHNGSHTSLDADSIISEGAGLVEDSDPFYDPNDTWTDDSLFSPLSSAEERRKSFISIFATPTFSESNTPKQLPKRFQHASFLSSPGFSPLNLPPSVEDKSSHLLIQLCHINISAILQYQHKPETDQFQAITRHLSDLQSAIDSIKDSPIAETPMKVLDLYTSLQLLLESTKTLEIVLVSASKSSNDDGCAELLSIKECSSISHCHQLIDTIAHQTALYCSKMLQDIMTGSLPLEESDNYSSLLSSIREVTVALGQVAMATRIEGDLFKRSQIGLPVLPNENMGELFRNGYQQWSSLFVERVRHHVSSSFDELQKMSFPAEQENQEHSLSHQCLCDVVRCTVEFVHQVASLQELFWQPYTDTDDSLVPPIDVIIPLLSSTAQLHMILTTLCNTAATVTDSSRLSTLNNELGQTVERLAIRFLSFLHDFSYDKAKNTVQTSARNVAMATRSLRQALKRSSDQLGSFTPHSLSDSSGTEST